MNEKSINDKLGKTQHLLNSSASFYLIPAKSNSASLNSAEIWMAKTHPVKNYYQHLKSLNKTKGGKFYIIFNYLF